MRRFSDQPIQRKVIIIILMGMGAAMGVALVNFSFFDRITAEKSLRQELTILARITAARSGAAVAFGDDRKATENLTHLFIRDSIQFACIYDATNTLFSFYGRGEKANLPCAEQYSDELLQNQHSFLVVEEPIEIRGASSGRILILSDYSPVTDRVIHWLWLSLIMIVIAVAIALLMTRRMQKAIVQPITHITEIMDEVRAKNDLALRAYPAGRDEIGDLVDAFNEMLDIVENGKLDLEIVYSELVNKSTKAEATAVELEARNEQIKEMLSGAVHDLRQPLQAMNIFIDMLEMSVEGDKQQSLVEKTQQAMNNLQDMFSEILDVSRLDHDEGTADIQEVNIAALFEKLQLEFSALARKKMLDLRVHIHPVTVYTVAGILERIIRNLVSNALNYTDSGGVLIAARSRKNGVQIEVWDTGRGIPDIKKETIFKKFEQVESENASPTKSRSGYGLGLAMVRQFVDILGYSLTVNSVEGRGSCFRIYIPNVLKRVENETIDYSGEIQEPEVGENYLQVLESLLQTTVFLVDDDKHIRDAMAMMLKTWDLGVVEFSGIPELINYFDSGDFIDPDIIISDYQLGNGTTGDEAIAEIRLAVGVDVPAFIVTGNTSSKIHNEIRGKGFEFMQKPVKSRDLKKMIESCLAQAI